MRSSRTSQRAGPPGGRAPRREAAGALVWVMAMLATLSILAAVLMPNQIRSLSETDREREAQALQRLKEGLREYILNTRSVPAASTVFTNLADTLGWEIGMTRTNHRGNPRVYLVDPNFRMGTTTANNLPFVQGVYGITNTSNLRLALVSSVGEPLPAILTNPGTNAALVFSMLWHAPEGAEPPGWTWGGNWADIRVARLDLEPLLTRIRLINSTNNAAGVVGRFSVGDFETVKNPQNAVGLPSSDFSALYFVRSTLGLYTHDNSLQTVQVLQDVPLATNGPPYLLMPTFVYEDGVWRGRFYKGTQAQKHNGDDLQAAYEIFMSGPANVYKVGSVTQTTLTTRMWEYMSNYVRWTELGFSSSFKSSVLQPSQQAMASELSTYCNKKASVN
jgi:type II secretory pathway pseudopilin PulG